MELAQKINGDNLALPALPLKKGRSGAELRKQFAKGKGLVSGLLKSIGDKFFGIKPPPNMMDLVMGMFGSNDD